VPSIQYSKYSIFNASFGCEQLVQVAYDWDQLRKLVEGGRYGDSQQLLIFVWFAVAVGKAAKIVI